MFCVSFSPPLFSPKGQGSPFKLLRVRGQTLLPLLDPGVGPGRSLHPSNLPASPLLSEAATTWTTSLAFCDFLIMQGNFHGGSLGRFPWEKLIKREYSAVLPGPSLALQTARCRNTMNPLKACISAGLPVTEMEHRGNGKSSYHLLSTYYELDLWIRCILCPVLLNFTPEWQGSVYYFQLVGEENDPRGFSRNPALTELEGE